MKSTTINTHLGIHNISGGTNPGQICGAAILGNLQFHNNTSSIQIGYSHSCAGDVVNGNLEVHDNSSSTAIFYNNVVGQSG
jgi:hypothetical protein